MYKYLLIIILIGLIGLIIYFIFPSFEPYENTTILTTRLLGASKYVRLNKFNRIDEIYVKPPQPRLGEKACWKLSNCPSWIPDTAICYKCI